MPAPGHFGAANRFGPTVCLKCTAAHSTPAHRCFCLLGCENRWSLPNTPPGYWALCTLLSYDSAPFLSCGKFPSGVRQGPVIACHLSGPCPRGPCGAGGLLDLPLVPLAWPRAACAASAGRAGGSWFFNSQPLTTWSLPRSKQQVSEGGVRGKSVKGKGGGGVPAEGAAPRSARTWPATKNT